jgi:hypothetical protein
MTFWSQPLEEYFPMEVLPGAHSTVDRWRKMASQFCSTGVDRRSGTRFAPFFDVANERWSLGPGAVWVNGFYAENTQPVIVETPGNAGLIVARLQPEIQEIRLLWRPGASPGDGLKDPEGWYDAELFWCEPGGGWQDLRRDVPLPWLPPPVTEMPAWVPRGFIGRAVGPGAGFPSDDPFQGGAGDVLVAYPSAWARWVSGRAYRFVVHTWWTATGGSGQVRFWVNDNHGLRFSQVLWNGTVDPSQGMVKTTSVTIRDVAGTIGTGQVVAVLTSEGGAPFPFMHWAANSSRIEVEDVGI